eukprot:NODE_6038_length_375_cov_93.846626_g5322_i0.p1 GENE.NODE_6038_length_375_cov_93.846626_g5322_i0~~NODE_6038_length_375_cov_93.846626_g5322_i0.p1  ORF type:complete len:50 (-),score=2.12 NODE_6038_length_375_cov_93.846626_g5322_i0:83-232(-)
MVAKTPDVRHAFPRTRCWAANLKNRVCFSCWVVLTLSSTLAGSVGCGST